MSFDNPQIKVYFRDGETFMIGGMKQIVLATKREFHKTCSLFLEKYFMKYKDFRQSKSSMRGEKRWQNDWFGDSQKAALD